MKRMTKDSRLYTDEEDAAVEEVNYNYKSCNEDENDDDLSMLRNKIKCRMYYNGNNKNGSNNNNIMKNKRKKEA